jgi:hypothetical protein
VEFKNDVTLATGDDVVEKCGRYSPRKATRELGVE